MDNKSVVIFEPYSNGHQFEYLKFIAEYFLIKKLNFDLFIIVSPSLYNRLIVNEKIKYGVYHNQISVIKLSSSDSIKCQNKIFWVRALFTYSIALKYCKLYGVNHLHFLFLDHMQLPLALRLPKPKSLSFSGILFRPSIHYSAFGQTGYSLSERLNIFRKKIMYQLMFTNPAVKTVFSLDQYFVLYSLNNSVYKKKTSYLSDPSVYPSINNQDDINLDSKIPLPNNRIIFLMFGVISRRKGIVETLNAILGVENAILKQAAFIFAGKIDIDLKKEIKFLLKIIKKTKQDVEIHFEDRFISDEEIVHLLKRCDTVLMPYQRHIGSSGVLIWAAIANKPVITQNFGLIGMLTKEYKLGLTIDTKNKNEIAKAIIHFIETKKRNLCILNKKNISDFLKNKTAEEFSSKIIDNLKHIIHNN